MGGTATKMTTEELKTTIIRYSGYKNLFNDALREYLLSKMSVENISYSEYDHARNFICR